MLVSNLGEDDVWLKKGDRCGLFELVSDADISSDICKPPAIDKTNRRYVHLSKNQTEVLDGLDLSLSDLDERDEDRLRTIICDYADVFSGTDNSLGQYIQRLLTT